MKDCTCKPSADSELTGRGRSIVRSVDSSALACMTGCSGGLPEAMCCAASPGSSMALLDLKERPGIADWLPWAVQNEPVTLALRSSTRGTSAPGHPVQRRTPEQKQERRCLLLFLCGTFTNVSVNETSTKAKLIGRVRCSAFSLVNVLGQTLNNQIKPLTK